MKVHFLILFWIYGMSVIHSHRPKMCQVLGWHWEWRDRWKDIAHLWDCSCSWTSLTLLSFSPCHPLPRRSWPDRREPDTSTGVRGGGGWTGGGGGQQRIHTREDAWAHFWNRGRSEGLHPAPWMLIAWRLHCSYIEHLLSARGVPS